MNNPKTEPTAQEKARATAAKIKAESEAEKQKAAAPKPAAPTPQQTAETVNKQLSPTTPPVTTAGRQFGKFTIRKAERSMSKLRIGLAGPSGSGKTYSALLLAHGLAEWEDIAIIDTENGSADLYSEMGPYNVLTLEKPFSPDRYVEAIQAAEDAGMKVIIVDSITHEWNGQGGALEIQEKLGGRFQDWAKVTPLHNRFIQTLLQNKAHIITTVRTKTDYAMSQEGGKGKVQKVGMKPETREGFEYEMTLSFDININHMAETSKDRTGLFKSGAPMIISEDTGKQLAEWAAGGIDYLTTLTELLQRKNVDPTILTNYYKVIDLSELTTFQYKEAITRLELRPDYDPTATPPKPAEPEKPDLEPKDATEPEQQSPKETDNKPEEPKAKTLPEATQETVDVDEIAEGIDKMNAEKEQNEGK